MGTETNSLKPGQSSASDKFGTGKIVIKFSGDFKIPYDEKTAEYFEKTDFKPWISLKKEYPGIEIRPLFTKSEQENLKILVKRAEKLNPRYKDPCLFSYFRITVQKDSEPPVILKLLKSWKELKHAYIEPVTVSANPLSNYGTNGNASSQNYLDAAPTGISSKSVWSPTTVSGSDGAGIKFIDLETGWNPSHDDIVVHAITLLGTNSTPSKIPHGTSVLGIVCASDNSIGCIGVAPKPASVKVISPTDTSIAGAITTAAVNLGYGDVLLIELQALDNSIYVPVEIDSAISGVIQTATSAGVIVVEPGGDGDLGLSAVNLNTYLTPVDHFDIFNSSSLNYVDTGAIIVSASKSMVSVLVPGTHEKCVWAPFGARVDSYAWGENITTIDTNVAGTDNTAVTNTFGYSSGAAAIIAGAILSIQGMVKASTNCKISPTAIRTLLRNSAYGTNLHKLGDPTLLSIFMPNLDLINSGFIPSLPVFSLTMSKKDAISYGSSDGWAKAEPNNGQPSFQYLWDDPLAQTSQTAGSLTAGTYNVKVTDGHGCIVTNSVIVGQPGDITATVTPTNVTCNGSATGTITITDIVGGVSPYQYSIDNGATWSSSNILPNLLPGTYTVIVKDSTGFTKSLPPVTINDIPALSASVSSLNLSGPGSHDGSISIALPSGGSGSYEYTIHGDPGWQSSGEFHLLDPGTYIVQMRDAVNTGCVKVLDPARVITEPVPAFTVTATVKDIIKFGDNTGSITLTVSGGTAPYSFTWSNSATTRNISGLVAGSYTVTVTDSSIPGAEVHLTVTVKHIYAEIERNVHHGILIKLLKFPLWALTGYKLYKVMWKGYPFHPPFFHPHVEVYFDHVTAGPILNETVGGVTWNYRWLKVPIAYEGDIHVLPSSSERPIFLRSITVPVKLFLVKQNSFPIFGRNLTLIADFKMIISNNNVDYSL